MIKNDKCAISDSELCKWLDKECKECYISNFKDKDEAIKALDSFKVTLSLLPENFDTLSGEECCFCKGEHKNSRLTYAIADLAHSEPESKTGMFFGMGKKVRQRIGSLLPVSISICGSCRSIFRRLEIIKWGTVLSFLAVSIGLCFIPAFNNNPVIPYAVVLIGGIIGYIVSKIVSAMYVTKKSKQTCFNVFEIPVCAKMKANGWFTVQDEGQITRFIFSKKPVIKRISDICGKEQKEQQQN